MKDFIIKGKPGWVITLDGCTDSLSYWERYGNSRNALKKRCRRWELAGKMGGQQHTVNDIVHLKKLEPILLIAPVEKQKPRERRPGDSEVRGLLSPRMLLDY